MSTAKFKTQSERDQLLRDMMRLSQDKMILSFMHDFVPPEWHSLTWDMETQPKKDKVTLYIDQPVIKFFRSMGSGYQARINHLLRSYMRLQVQGLLDTERALKERTQEGEEENG